MKLTESHLRNIIREELSKLNEGKAVRHIPSMKEEKLEQIGNGGRVNRFRSLRQFLDLAGVGSIREFGQKYEGIPSKGVAMTQADKADRFTLVEAPDGAITMVAEMDGRQMAVGLYFGPPDRYSEHWKIATGAGSSSGTGRVPSKYEGNLGRLLDERGIQL